jgi:tripartite-type tricarboxylate transporter receptor subunit TctC
MLRASLVAFALAAVALAPPASAQGYPSRPIRMVVPFGAGGATDIIARVLAERAGTEIGQRVVVENRPGAAGNIGADAVAKTPADGYTWLMASVSIVAVNPFIFRDMLYDVQRDLRPVVLAAAISGMIAATPGLAANTVAELVALARQRPGQLSFASAGSGSTSHMQGELFQMLTGVGLLHVPYRSAPPAMADLASGRVDLVFDSAPTLMGHVTAGRLKAIAMASERSPLLPGIATVAEQGVAGYDTRGWFGIMLPTGAAEEVTRSINGAMNRALSAADVRQALAAQGAEPLGGTPADFEALAARDRDRWQAVVRHANIRPE